MLQFVNGESYLAGQFRQIKRCLAEQWRFTSKKNTLMVEVYWVWFGIDILPSSFSCPGPPALSVRPQPTNPK